MANELLTGASKMAQDLWLLAFDEALADGFNSIQAKFYADGVVRQYLQH